MEISVIIPTYKPGEYIYKCLESLKNQSLNVDKFEVIIVLNGERIPFEENICIFVEKNLIELNVVLLHTFVTGVSNARNIAIDTSKGNYITFLDDDDYISENYLENLLSCAASNIVSVSNLKTFDEQNNFEKDYISECFDNHYLKKDFSIFSCRSFYSSVCGKLISKNIIRNSRYNTKRSLGEDSLFMFEISRFIERTKLAAPDTYYYRRIREGSVSRAKRPLFDRIIKDVIELNFLYFKIFITDILNYNFLFFVSRQVSSIINVFK